MSSCPRDGHSLAPNSESVHNAWGCPDCNGVWLPATSVVDLIGKAKKPKESSQVVVGQVLRCPDDAGVLIAVRKHGVEIDVCENCGGVWLDRGELEEMERKSSVPTAAEVGEVTLYGLDLALELVGTVLDGL